VTSKRIVNGTPDLVVEDRVTVGDPKYRFRAYLKGRTAGGMLHGFGPTEDAACADLERVYRRELAAVSAGRHELAEGRPPRD
jgi:hypothetical protein